MPNWKLAVPVAPPGFTEPFSVALELVMLVAAPVVTGVVKDVRLCTDPYIVSPLLELENTVRK